MGHELYARPTAFSGIDADHPVPSVQLLPIICVHIGRPWINLLNTMRKFLALAAFIAASVVSGLAAEGPIIRNPVTTNRFLNSPSNGDISYWDSLLKVWTNGPAPSPTGGGQPASTILTNLSGTGALTNESQLNDLAGRYVWDGRGPNTNAPDLLIDLDYGGDSDDALDLKLAVEMHRQGLFKIRSVTHSDSNNWSAASLSAALSYYGLSVPVGSAKGPHASTVDVYGSYIATNYQSPVKFWLTNALPAVSVMRYALQNSPDSNALIITTGPLRNIQELINSPADGISSLTGSQLLIKKLRPDLGMIIVAGIFTNSSGLPNGPDFNIVGDQNGSAWVNSYTPNSFPVTWFGTEAFGAVQTAVGYATNMSKYDPAYIALSFQGVNGRPGWAQGAFLLAGLGTNITYGAATGSNAFSFVHGTNQIVINGSNVWRNVSYVGQKYTVRLGDTNWFAEIINSLLMPSPRDALDYVQRRGGDVISGGKYQYTNGSTIYVGSNPNNFVADIYSRNSGGGSGSLVLQDFLGLSSSHFHFDQNEDNYLRGGRALNYGYNFLNTLAGDNNNIFGSGSNTNILNGATVVSNVTPDRVAVINSVNKLTNSANVSVSELEFVDGVTSSIQTQLNGKQQGSFLLTNFVLMGISNIVSANANTVLTTNNGVLIITTASGGSGGTNNPAVLLQAGNTNLTGQSGNITAHYQATNGSHGIDFDLAVPVSGQTFRNFETNSAGTNYVVTFYTNGVAGKFYNPESLTNETSYIVPAGALTMAEFVATTPGNWTLTRHVQPVLRPVFSTGLSVVTNGVNGLDAVITATATGSSSNREQVVNLTMGATTNIVIDLALTSSNKVIFNVAMLTNGTVNISNAALRANSAEVNFQQDSNGIRIINLIRSTDGLVRTATNSAPLTLTTNANATDKFVIGSDYFQTNITVSAGASVASPVGPSGSIQFAETGLFAGTNIFTYDRTNGRVGIGVSQPATTLELVSSSPQLVLRDSVGGARALYYASGISFSNVAASSFGFFVAGESVKWLIESTGRNSFAPGTSNSTDIGTPFRYVGGVYANTNITKESVIIGTNVVLSSTNSYQATNSGSISLSGATDRFTLRSVTTGAGPNSVFEWTMPNNSTLGIRCTMASRSVSGGTNMSFYSRDALAYCSNSVVTVVLTTAALADIEQMTLSDFVIDGSSQLIRWRYTGIGAAAINHTLNLELSPIQ